MYIDLLIRWNARINLTAIRDPEAIVTRHFGESLFAAQRLFPAQARVGPGLRPGQAERSSAAVRAPDVSALAQNRGRSARQRRVTGHEAIGALTPAPANDQRPATNDRPAVADLGSGAGFPGLPIKLWAPGIALTLIESNHKKAAFLREVVRALTLTEVNIQAVRAETLATVFDLVTLRAVERFAATLPIAASLVAPGGHLALLISSAQLDQARASLPNFSWATPEPIPLSESRVLVIAHRPFQ
ncbi:MAG: 16S rRNA (guanine(527)-N(7))-methyltransferase RsmG [Candidatus Sulfotelmatobacter sp.]